MLNLLKFLLAIYQLLRGPTPECCPPISGIGGPDVTEPSLWDKFLQKAGLVKVRVLYIIFEAYVQQAI